MPGWVVVANTVLLEAAVVGAIYWLIVRRAANRRRATLWFVCGLVVFVGLEGVGALEVLAPRTAHVHVIGGNSKLMAAFHWETTVVLGRDPTGRSVVVYEDRAVFHHHSDIGRQNVIEGSALSDELWTLHEAPNTAESMRAVCAAVRRSPAFATLPAEVAALVSDG
jgi:hypothetical protein